jgi:formylglycine-generating enzyme required for sulfatase activity
VQTGDLTAEYGELPAASSENPSRDTVTPKWTTITNSIGMEFALIEAGEFVMGSPQTEAERLPDEVQHRVRISRPYYLGCFEVTQDEYGLVTGNHPSEHSPSGRRRRMDGNPYSGHFPVTNVTWNDAEEFCRRLSALPEEIEAGRRYRLPTEAEWEYACRGGSTTVFAFGDSLSAGQANIKGTEPYGNGAPGIAWRRPRAVGSYPPNDFGIYDMHGNAWEWCRDWYAPYDQSALTEDPAGPVEGTKKVLRGSCCYLAAHFARSARRNSEAATFTAPNLGLRVVCEVQ